MSINTPNAVIGSLSMAAANNHWLIPTPHRAQIKSVLKSFGRTFSLGMKRDASQTIMQAKVAHMMVIASGDTSAVSRYLNTGILTANRMFADNIRICSFIWLCYQTFVCILSSILISFCLGRKAFSAG